MPHDNNTEVCTIENVVTCARVADLKVKENIDSCGCLEPCTSIEYKVANLQNSDFDYISPSSNVLTSKLLKEFTDQG
jgi:hypothetical protein